MYLSKKRKEEIKNKAITDLYNSKQIHNKLPGIMTRHRIPMHAEIENDIIQVCFENLSKYPTDKFVEAYQDKKERIVGLAVRILLTKCIYKDSRIPKGWNHSIAQQILFGGVLNSLDHIDSTSDDTDNFNIPQISPHLEEEYEEENIQMWSYVKRQLNNEENQILNSCLQPNSSKMKGLVKKQYQALLPKLKIIITEYLNKN